MKIEEAKQRLWATGKINTLSKVECDHIIDEIYKDTPENIRCDGCIHKPDIGENFKEECGTCSRFYADGWEPHTDSNIWIQVEEPKELLWYWSLQDQEGDWSISNYMFTESDVKDMTENYTRLDTLGSKNEI